MAHSTESNEIQEKDAYVCIYTYIYLLMYLYAKPPKVIDKNCNM